MKEEHQISVLSMPSVCAICGELWKDHVCNCGHRLNRHFMGEEEPCREIDCKCERFDLDSIRYEK